LSDDRRAESGRSRLVPVDMSNMKHVDKFFSYARERYRIYLRRQTGRPRPWTSDPILQENPFCNVFREDDRTTVWFREHVREPLSDRPEALLATVVFRMFNRISTGEAIFDQGDLVSGSPFGEFVESGDWRALRRAVRAYCGAGPYVTGAYIISSPPGYDKLTGICRVLGEFARHSGWRAVAVDCLHRPEPYSLAALWWWLRDQPYLGPFHAYEIVTDLRHTHLLSRAKDINLFANPGPGAKRGLNRVHGRGASSKKVTGDMLEDMCEILRMSRNNRYWSRKWPRWELREVEHTLCEFDKYERVRKKQGRIKGKFRGKSS
jgi:alpha-glutamyl/putrescinyl thymine pyrophosphorylase clade 1